MPPLLLAARLNHYGRLRWSGKLDFSAPHTGQAAAVIECVHLADLRGRHTWRPWCDRGWNTRHRCRDAQRSGGCRDHCRITHAAAHPEWRDVYHRREIHDRRRWHPPCHHFVGWQDNKRARCHAEAARHHRTSCNLQSHLFPFAFGRRWLRPEIVKLGIFSSYAANGKVAEGAKMQKLSFPQPPA